MIPGISSQYDNHHEDRKFFLTICELRPRCTELVKVKYDNSNFNIINQTNKVILAKETKTNNEDFDKPWNPSYSTKAMKSSPLLGLFCGSEFCSEFCGFSLLKI